MTHTVAVLSGAAEFALSFVLGLAVAYCSFRLLSRMTRNLDELQELKKNNTAVGILSASMLLSTALVARQALYPIVSTLQTKLFEGLTPGAALRWVALSASYTAFAVVVAAGAVVLGTRVFVGLTRDIDELAEIERNNVAVALTLGAVIVVMGLFLSHGVESLLAAVIPEPSLANIRVLGGR